MHIATLLFTYNRSYHTEQVIKGLKSSMMPIQKLFVFQDGLNEGADDTEWRRVNNLIQNIDWCEKEIIVSDCNKGLAKSIVSGIDYVFKRYDAVIVLEDDCVPATNFIGFMEQCFKKYQDDKRVYSVSGYAWPIELQKEEYDIYGCGRISSWGWGTWKDRWEQYEKDYELLGKMRKDEKASRNLAIWGSDLENILIGNIIGECDSWAVFWTLKVIEKEGICINPYQSLIKNIGMDGSGVHCKDVDGWNVNYTENKKTTFCLPEEISVSDEVIKTYIPLFGHYAAINERDEKKEEILIYGVGNLYRQNEQKICEKYFIKAYIDQKKLEWLDGKKVIKKEEVEQYTYDRILIMIKERQECMKVMEELLAQNVDPDKILIGRDLY